MFDGKVGKRVVNFSGNRREPEKKSAKALSEESKRQREQRAQQKVLSDAATRIQKIVRMHLNRKKNLNGFRAVFDKRFNDIRNLKNVFAAKRATFNVPLAAIDTVLQSFLFFYSGASDSNRLVQLSELLLESITHASAEFNYMASLISCKWDIALEKYDNMKLLRLKKFCILCMRQLCSGSATSSDSIFRLLSTVTVLATDSTVSEQFLKTVMCCLLCEEAARGLAWSMSHSCKGQELFLSIVQQCIGCISLVSSTSDSSIPWNVVLATREV